MNSNSSYLCGGTLLTLLLHYKRPYLKTPITVLSRKSFLGQNDFINHLIRIMRPNHEPYNKDTFSNQASNYKNCLVSEGTDIPFHEKFYIEKYEQRIEMDYFRVAMEMNEIVLAYLNLYDADKANTLVKALLGILAADDTIPDDEPIYALPDGGLTSKGELLHSETICISSLVIGLLLYVTKNVPDNKIGRETILSWKESGMDQAIAQISADIPTPNIELTVPEQTPEEDEIDERPDIDEKCIAHFSNYLQNLYESYSKVPSFFQGGSVEFDSFYVCPNLVKTSITGKVNRNIQNPTQEKLRDYARLVGIYGIGGLGKSMLSRHILLTAINDFPKTGLLPFFIELRQYMEEELSFEEYLYQQEEDLWNHSLQSFSRYLEKYPTLLILDGMDEIKEEYYPHFERTIDEFVYKYKDVQVIVTSRKIENRNLRKFSSLDLSLLTLPQAKELIRKIGYRKDTAPEICEGFIEKLDGLYRDFDQYVGNPLLLNIMLLTYTETGGVLSGSMYRFFEEAYDALSYRHDRIHKNGFQRSFYTGLTTKKLKKVINEFCGSGYNDWNFTFTNEQVSFYLKDMLSYQRHNIAPVDPDAFLEDMECSLSLMYEASIGRYAFYHRSFQEYFAASYVFGLDDSELFEASQMFEKGRSSMDDCAFPMFYEMSPERVEKYVFLPMLQELFSDCESSDENESSEHCATDDLKSSTNGCLNYLTKSYELIPYQVGTVDEVISNPTDSLRLTFILNVIGCHEELIDELIDVEVPFPTGIEPEERYYEVDDEAGGRMVICEDQIQWKQEHGFTNLDNALQIIEMDRRGELSDKLKLTIDDICEGNPEKAGMIYLFETSLLRKKKFEKEM